MQSRRLGAWYGKKTTAWKKLGTATAATIAPITHSQPLAGRSVRLASTTTAARHSS